MQTNLLCHEVLKILEEFALPELRGDVGRPRLEERLDAALRTLGTTGETARLTDLRKLWHDGWKALLADTIEPTLHESATDRFRGLIF